MKHCIADSEKILGAEALGKRATVRFHRSSRCVILWNDDGFDGACPLDVGMILVPASSGHPSRFIIPWTCRRVDGTIRQNTFLKSLQNSFCINFCFRTVVCNDAFGSQARAFFFCAPDLHLHSGFRVITFRLDVFLRPFDQPEVHY